MKKYLIVALSLILALVVSPKQSSACSFASTPWYKITFEAEKDKLPIGLSVQKYDAYENESIETIQFINNLEIPIYIGIDQYGQKDKKFVYKYKLEKQLLYKYEYDYEPSKKDFYWKYWNASGLKVDSTLINELNPNKFNGSSNVWNIHEDNRPDNVELPEPLTYNIIMIQSDIRYEVPIHISFSLNEKYNPNSIKNGIALCDEFNTGNKKFYEVENTLEKELKLEVKSYILPTFLISITFKSVVFITIIIIYKIVKLNKLKK